MRWVGMERDHLEDPGIDGRGLKSVLKQWDGGHGRG